MPSRPIPEGTGTLGMLLTFLILLSACSPSPRSASLSQPGALEPGAMGSEWSLSFEHVYRAETHWVEDARVHSIQWSTTRGELEYRWLGYESHPESGESFALFEYDLRNLSHEEGSSLGPEGRTWSMSVDDDGVSMQRSGLSWPNPMGEMRGDPRDHFLKKGSLVVLDPWGVPKRIEGRLNPAKYRNKSADIGPHFLGGWRVETWAHAPFMPAPQDGEKAWTTQSSYFPGWLENWTLSEEEMAFEMKARQSMPKARPQGHSRDVFRLVMERHLKGRLNSKTRLPEDVQVLDRGSWEEEIIMPDADGEGKITPLLKTVFEHSFRAHRP